MLLDISSFFWRDNDIFFLFLIIKNGELFHFHSKLTQLVWCRTFREQNVRMPFQCPGKFCHLLHIFCFKKLSPEYKRLPASANQLLKEKRFQSKLKITFQKIS